MSVLLEVATGVLTAFQCFIRLCGAVFGVHYIAERGKKNDISYFQFVMLLLIIGLLAFSAGDIKLNVLSTIISKISFAVSAILFLYTLVHIGIKTYQDYGGNIGKWTIGIAIFISIFVLAQIFF